MQRMQALTGVAGVVTAVVPGTVRVGAGPDVALVLQRALNLRLDLRGGAGVRAAQRLAHQLVRVGDQQLQPGLQVQGTSW